MKKINSALISVYHKDNLESVVETLNNLGVKIISTGGTQSFIEELGIQVTPAEEITSYPSILGGRVKTLHPAIFGGILRRDENESDLLELEKHQIEPIDLVIVDLYPFEETVAAGGSESEIIEKIDIGGISLIRAAAKNYKDCLIVSSRTQYSDLVDLLKTNEGTTSIDDRKGYAAHAFNMSSHYDTAIFNYFNSDSSISAFKASNLESNVLRYGENPHQNGEFYGQLDAMFDKLNGKELSYNNLVDVDAAVRLIDDFTDKPTFAIIKHTNACGLATGENIKDAYVKALSCDNLSAFGGILVANGTIELDAAEEIHSLFCEVVIAPDFSEDALALLKEKKNRIILKRKNVQLPKREYKSILNGTLVQDKDMDYEANEKFETVTNASPSSQQIEALKFANKLVKHTKSNTIILCDDKQLYASGTGQTSRVDALQQAIAKAKHFGFDLNNAVMASDAFFPFPDCVEIAGKVGIKAVIQPGGSIKDKDSIAYCDQNSMAMVMTGIRHFKH